MLLRFSRALELRYRRDVAYHCSLHAADVLHAAHVLLRCTALRVGHGVTGGQRSRGHRGCGVRGYGVRIWGQGI